VTDIAVAAEQAHLLSLVSGASKVTCAAAGTNNLVSAAYSKAMPARGQNVGRVD
jgi:LSD1 subclass zinc finger protein